MSHRTALELTLTRYGESVRGASLNFYPAREKCKLLIIAGIHGEESDGTISLSRALRSIPPTRLAGNIAFVLCANPDGVTLGTRGNANGVDLNRNFPASNWSPAPSSCRWHADEDETLPISTGSSAVSEPETRALISLIQDLAPSRILTLHGPLACVDDPDASPLAQWIADETALPLVREIGYPTPGSMGSWVKEQKIPIITWEFPPDGIETLSRSQVPVLVEILKGNFPS